MKKLLIFIASSVVGGISGYFIGYKVAKKKYLAQADKDVQSVIDSYNRYYGVNTEKTPQTPDSEQKADAKEEKSPLMDKDSIDYEALKNYKNHVERYTNIKKDEKEEVNSPDKQIDAKITLISPDEAVNEKDYNTETLTWYADNVLADDDYNIINNINEVIGKEALNSFGLYEEDVVYVRNDYYEVIYEVVLDERTYAETAPKHIVNAYPDED